jgi:chemotaxis protein CheC
MSALLEAGNIGSGHAAIALSQMMGRKIMVAIPSIEVVPVSRIAGVIQSRGEVVQIELSVSGDITGLIFFTMNAQPAGKLCDIVMGQAFGTTKQLGNVEESAIKEISSILGSSYLNSISEMTSLTMMVSVPEYFLGDIEHLIKIVAHGMAPGGTEATVFCIKTEFIEANSKVEGYLVFAPREDGAKKLVERLISHGR